MSKMPISLNQLKTWQGEAVEVGKDLGLMTVNLTEKELIRFGRSFERQFIRNLPERQSVDIHLRHLPEALLGALIAKEQMDQEIDGEVPASNKIGGPYPIRAAWLGVGDDWEDLLGIYGGTQNSWTTGAVANWIHSGTSLLGGTGGNAVRILENAVHIIYGLYSVHASPKIESVQFTIDGKTKPPQYLHWAQKCNPGKGQFIKELDSCYILKKDTTFRAQVFISNAFGAAAEFQVDYPALFGVSYVKEPPLRERFDPAGLPGTVHNVITTS